MFIYLFILICRHGLLRGFIPKTSQVILLRNSSIPRIRFMNDFRKSFHFFMDFFGYSFRDFLKKSSKDFYRNSTKIICMIPSGSHSEILSAIHLEIPPSIASGISSEICRSHYDIDLQRLLQYSKDVLEILAGFS